MHCQEFEAIVHDLARGRNLDAAAVEAGTAHACSCARCDTLLEEAGELAKALGFLKTQVAAKQRSAGLELRLRDELRKRWQAEAAARTHAARRRVWIAAAVAAAFLLAVAFGLRHARAPGMGISQQRQVFTSAAVPAPATAAEARPGPAEAATALGQIGPRQANRLASEPEFDADFYPLPYDDPRIPLDGGEIVRVELPPTALAEWGLPLDFASGMEPVPADLLIGQDGVPRAIRFVQ